MGISSISSDKVGTLKVDFAEELLDRAVGGVPVGEVLSELKLTDGGLDGLLSLRHVPGKRHHSQHYPQSSSREPAI